MKRYLLVRLTLLMTFIILPTQTTPAQEVVKERGFGAQGPSDQGFNKPLVKRARVGATMPTFNAAAQVAIVQGLKQAAKDYNIDLTVLDGENDPDKQLSQIENFITEKRDVIMISAVDATALVSGVKAANKAGIPVLNFDRRVIGGGDVFVYVGSEWTLTGLQSGMQMVTAINGQGNIVIIEGTPGSSVTHERLAGFKAAINLYPEIKVIAQQPGNFNPADGQKAMEDILQAHPKGIDAVWFMNDDMFHGGLTAIQAAGRRKEMKLLSIDGDHRACEAVKNGDLDGEILLDIYGMGYEPVRAVAQYLNGRRDFPAWIKLWTTPIDSSNIDRYLDQCW
jgi:ribose transport system substrate-binding protein